MSDQPKLATEMTAAEWKVARTAAIEAARAAGIRGSAMTAAELAALASRPREKPVTKHPLDMTELEYAAARQRAVRGDFT